MVRYRHLSYRYLAVVVLSALFMVILGGSVRAQSSYDSEELAFLQIINEYRQNNGLPTLILSDALTDASERHDEDMARYNFFAHETLGSSYFPINSKPWDRMALSGYDYPEASMSENLAAGYETAEEAFEAWRTSPGHNVNMLDGNQKVIGIARIYDPDSYYGWYWTTDFGSELDPTSHAPGEPSEQRASQNEQTTEQEQEPERRRQESGKAGDDRNVDKAGVENGSMKKDGIWEQKTAKEGNDLIDEGVARLGGYDDAKDELLQSIRISKGQSLTYRVRVETEETEHPTDGLVVRLTDGNGRHLVTLESHTDADAQSSGDDSWVEESVDLSRFAGRTVKLAFLAKTDEARPTTFYVDDVALE
ncbi:MAG: hypothetical protein AVDCRST_MAG14-1229 [uncultured Rubrobacteraceae bacterium]|uniref:SCP domain-containing protein n=1 Tax=uncultured Rubrobacteraceae bacterium TaxID=349277 RepID=A0A6J4QX90_9ACTN|nr:MAG: hypothetical protein AVDCRST_MAG14-1229 [uncultured Rubrobacteraceae bacterium]